MAQPSVDPSQLLAEMDSQRPRRTTVQPFRSNVCLAVILQKDAWDEAGIDLDDPPELDQWWFPEEGVVVTELPDSNGGDADGNTPR